MPRLPRSAVALLLAACTSAPAPASGPASSATAASAPPPAPVAERPAPSPEPASGPSSARRASAPPLALDDFFRGLPAVLAGPEPERRARLEAERTSGVTLAGSEGLDLVLAPPVDARRLATLLGIPGDLFIVSGDVHQRSWRLVRRTGTLTDRRIATELPSVGDLRLDLTVSERPSGPLPGVSAGASPAYPLAGRSAFVTRMRLLK